MLSSIIDELEVEHGSMKLVVCTVVDWPEALQTAVNIELLNRPES